MKVETLERNYPNSVAQIRANERERIIKEVALHLREAGYTYDYNMGIGDNIGSALLKEYANGYAKGEQDGSADERAKTIAEVSIELDKYHNDICIASYPFNFIDKALGDVRRRK